jgi:exonuclease VII small subunit
MSNGDVPKDLDRGIKDLDRAIKDLDRAIKDLDRGGGIGAGGIVDDVFRRVGGLGGLLVVAFVAPVNASAGSGNQPRGPRGLAMTSTATKAEARGHEEMLQKLKEQEEMLQKLKEQKEALEQRIKTFEQGAKPK